MKRRLVFLVLLLFLAAGGIWYLVFRQSGMYRVREGIPEDAVFIVETPSFNRIRDKLYRNRIWASLKAYPYFEEYHANLNLADSLSEVYPGLRELLTDRPLRCPAIWFLQPIMTYCMSAILGNWMLSRHSTAWWEGCWATDK